MKKIISIILIAALTVLALVSCTPEETLDGKTADEAIALISTKMGETEANSYRAVCNAVATTSIFDSEYVIEFSINAATRVEGEGDSAKHSSAGGMSMEMPNPIGSGNIAIDIDYVVIDGMMYYTYTSDGDEMKYKGEIEDFAEMSPIEDYDQVIDWKEIAELENVKIEKTEDGKFKISAESITDDLIADLISEIVGESSDSQGEQTNNVSELSFEIIAAPNGFCEAINLSFALEVSGSVMTFDYNFAFEKLAADFKIEAPADADAYTDVSEIMGK